MPGAFGTGPSPWRQSGTTMDDELLDIARQVKNHLTYYSSLGVEYLPRVEAPPVKKAVATNDETLEDIRADLGPCTRCPLCQGRNNIVFGEGPPDASVMFVGEGPGREEDIQGRPFVGRSGQLLTDIIVKGMKLMREDCYIGNIVKCRPPENRDPLPDEAAVCLPFLMRQIEAIKPRVIIALGRIASQYLLGTTEPLGRLRNRFHDLHGIPVMPTFHPSALLRFPERKRETWEDIKLVNALLAK